MEKKLMEQLPEVLLYRIGSREADHAAPLLTEEALEYIRAGEAFGLALVEEGEARAAVCARISPENEVVMELISLYVAPAFRRRGLGSTLFYELCDGAMEATDGSLCWMTASFASDADGVEPLLSAVGFQIEQDERAVSWQLPLGSLGESTLMERMIPVRKGQSLIKLEELSDFQVRRLVKELNMNGVDDCSAGEMRRAQQSASYVLFDSEQKPRACAVFTVQGEKKVFLSRFFLARGENTAAMSVLQASAGVLLEMFSADTVLEIPTVADSSARLVKKLLPDSRAVCMARAVFDL